jgi:orotidine-5'-phosphate decarboxylase
MTRDNLFEAIRKKESYLCVGLDTDIRKIPPHLQGAEDPVFEFNKQIIDATARYCIAYKPNIAFYEAQGPKGWESLKKTIDYIPKDIFTIADAKRGDIGNTSALYARTFFDVSACGLNFDAVTVAPYMGKDSVKPFLDFKDKWVILLALTSNEGSQDFQSLEINNNQEKLFEKVLKKGKEWANENQLMYVVGATQGELFKEVRQIVPEHFLLVPGVGAQGGDLETVSKHGLNGRGGLIVNASRSIIYASSEVGFAKSAQKAAIAIQEEMNHYLNIYL